MNQGIPKPLRNALARHGLSDVHPSPDVLTSFMERTLPPGESEVVTHHLARCAECREIVFLASSAAEDEVPHVQDLVAAAVPGREAAMPTYAAMLRPESAQTETRRSKWTVRTRWVMAFAAAVVLVSGGVVRQYWRATHEYQNTAAVTVYRPAPASSPEQPTVSAPNSQNAAGKTPAPEKSLAKAAPQPATAAQAKKIPAQTAEVASAADQATSAPAPAPENAAKAKSSDAMAGALGGMNRATVPEGRPQSPLAESAPAQRTDSSQQYKLKQQDKSAQQSTSAQAQQDKSAQQGTSTPSPQLQKRAPALFGKPAATGMDAVSAVRPQWRIGANGHLEHSLAPNQWSRVLDDQSVTFHAVAVIGSDVWAGGNGGAFFHSSDGGEHWSKVSLGANSKVETGAIVSIRFDDVQHGTVASDSGTRWTTTDGGVTWKTQ